VFGFTEELTYSYVRVRKAVQGFHTTYASCNVSNSVFIQRQLANTVQGNKMVSILSFKREHANNAYLGDGKEKKRVYKMAAHCRSQFWSGKYLARHSHNVLIF
jgi:hypothetical protein